MQRTLIGIPRRNPRISYVHAGVRNEIAGYPCNQHPSISQSAVLSPWRDRHSYCSLLLIRSIILQENVLIEYCRNNAGDSLCLVDATVPLKFFHVSSNQRVPFQQSWQVLYTAVIANRAIRLNYDNDVSLILYCPLYKLFIYFLNSWHNFSIEYATPKEDRGSSATNTRDRVVKGRRKDRAHRGGDL